jgi:hypothetical protein
MICIIYRYASLDLTKNSRPRACDMTDDSAAAEIGRREPAAIGIEVDVADQSSAIAGWCLFSAVVRSGLFDEGDLSLAAMGKPLVLPAQGA